MSNRLKIREGYEFSEQEAKAKKVGLWQDKNPVGAAVGVSESVSAMILATFLAERYIAPIGFS